MSQEIIATVAGEPITQADFEAFAERLPQQAKMYLDDPQAKKYYQDQLIGMRLFAAYGADQKLDETEEFKATLAAIKRDMLSQMAVRNFLETVTVSDEEVKALYDQNQDQFMTEEKVAAKHILVDDLDKALVVLKEIKAGKSFEDAATEYSTCPSKEKGGDLGEFGRGQMVKEFENAAFKAEVDKVTGPVKTQFGYHLIKVTARQEAKQMQFEEIKDSIRQDMIQRKQNDAYNEKVKALRDQYMD